jgi:hypothetical protein
VFYPNKTQQLTVVQYVFFFFSFLLFGSKRGKEAAKTNNNNPSKRRLLQKEMQGDEAKVLLGFPPNSRPTLSQVNSLSLSLSPSSISSAILILTQGLIR